jgi:modulator of FtsH protease
MDRKIYQSKVIPIFTLSLIITFIASFIGFLFVDLLADLIVFIAIAAASFVVLIILITWQRRNLPLLFVFNWLEGFLLTPLMVVANLTDPLIIPEAFGITSAAFVAISLYGWRAKKDVSSWTGILFGLLIVAVVLTILQFFIQSNAFGMIVDAGIALLFMFLIFYDTEKILQKYSNKDVVPAVVALYLDFINLFIRIISLLLRTRREEK